jgi:hypothetical protein
MKNDEVTGLKLPSRSRFGYPKFSLAEKDVDSNKIVPDTDHADQSFSSCLHRYCSSWCNSLITGIDIAENPTEVNE